MKYVKLFGKFLVLLLSVTLISSLLPNKIVSLGLSIDDKGLSKERFYRQLIMQNVSSCTWNSETNIYSTTELYNIDGKISGYIYEYQNKNYPSGFMQLDKMNNEFVLNCYSFGDDHFAVRKMKETTIDSINLMKNKKLLYLNGNYYITDFNNLTSKEFIVYDILNNSNIMINRNEAEQIPKASYANTGISKSANNVSVMVQGYTSMRLATYNNVNDSGIGCAAIVGTNICMYWANFRGKASLAPTMMSTYTDLYKKMNIRSSTSGGTTCTEAYNGLKSYVNGKGYAIPYSGTASNSTFSWNWLVNRIDRGMPFALPLFYNLSGVSTQRVRHFLAVFGYQILNSEKIVIMADPNQSSMVYRAYYSLPANGVMIPSNDFAFYVGW